MSERHNFSLMLYTPYGLYLTKSQSQAKKFENNPTAGEFFLENVILKVTQTHFSKDFYPKGGGGNAPIPLVSPRGAVKYPALVELLPH